MYSLHHHTMQDLTTPLITIIIIIPIITNTKTNNSSAHLPASLPRLKRSSNRPQYQFKQEEEPSPFNRNANNPNFSYTTHHLQQQLVLNSQYVQKRYMMMVLV